jgi:hypothetical protein
MIYTLEAQVASESQKTKQALQDVVFTMSKVEQMVEARGIYADGASLSNSKPSEVTLSPIDGGKKLKAMMNKLGDQVSDMIKLQNILNFEMIKRMENHNLRLSSAGELESAGANSQALTPRLESNAHIIVPLD